MNKIYRTDIDGLRAIAVISVILFHLGYLSNGYLGVDIFFVISGYLITGIVYNEVEEDKFSVLKFYERRIRRIIPLVLFTTLIAFLLGLAFMLPDDLENMCQSVIASNFSANNILMYITSADYWAVKNEYKPLMHTWSLGIEEQFYLLYPVMFFFLKGSRKKFIVPLLVILTVISLGLFFKSHIVSAKFYFLQYRFFELSIGGICAIYFSKKQIASKIPGSQYILYLLLCLTIFLLYFNTIKSNDIKVLLTVIFSGGILVLGGLNFRTDAIYKALISNKLFTGIGKISFSLYMWHQIVFAFARYFLIETITPAYAVLLSAIIVLLSVISYYSIENTFRNRKLIKTKPLLIVVSSFFLIITLASFYVYAVGGIIKDVPELGITKSTTPRQLNFFSQTSNINIQYNENVRAKDTAFSNSNNIKVLVIGDSYGRDFANVILESSFKHKVEVSYIYDPKNNPETRERFSKANYIFYATNSPATKKIVSKRIDSFSVDSNKLWVVGIKDFGNSNGIFYNRKHKDRCEEYKATMKKGILETNQLWKSEWGDHYINLLELVTDPAGKVLVFTPDCKFISQDTKHLTKFGAVFFAQLLDSRLRKIMNF